MLNTAGWTYQEWLTALQQIMPPGLAMVYAWIAWWYREGGGF